MTEADKIRAIIAKLSKQNDDNAKLIAFLEDILESNPHLAHVVN